MTVVVVTISSNKKSPQKGDLHKQQTTTLLREFTMLWL
jgi:hypothetical protein